MNSAVRELLSKFTILEKNNYTCVLCLRMMEVYDTMLSRGVLLNHDIILLMMRLGQGLEHR